MQVRYFILSFDVATSVSNLHNSLLETYDKRPWTFEVKLFILLMMHLRHYCTQLRSLVMFLLRYFISLFCVLILLCERNACIKRDISMTNGDERCNLFS